LITHWQPLGYIWHPLRAAEMAYNYITPTIHNQLGRYIFTYIRLYVYLFLFSPGAGNKKKKKKSNHERTHTHIHSKPQKGKKKRNKFLIIIISFYFFGAVCYEFHYIIRGRRLSLKRRVITAIITSHFSLSRRV
jgi:hypothetical protein